MPWSIFEVRFQGVRLVSGMFPLQRHYLSRAEPGAAPRDQLRDGPGTLGHGSPFWQQSACAVARGPRRPSQNQFKSVIAETDVGEARRCVIVTKALVLLKQTVSKCTHWPSQGSGNIFVQVCCGPSYTEQGQGSWGWDGVEAGDL